MTNVPSNKWYLAKPFFFFCFFFPFILSTSENISWKPLSQIKITGKKTPGLLNYTISEVISMHMWTWKSSRATSCGTWSQHSENDLGRTLFQTRFPCLFRHLVWKLMEAELTQSSSLKEINMRGQILNWEKYAKHRHWDRNEIYTGDTSKFKIVGHEYVYIKLKIKKDSFLYNIININLTYILFFI